MKAKEEKPPKPKAAAKKKKRAASPDSALTDDEVKAARKKGKTGELPPLSACKCQSIWSSGLAVCHHLRTK